jgi:hypothetical protein
MSIRTKLMTMALALTASVAMAAEPALIIPAAGSGAGASGSSWRSELTLHNAGIHPVEVTLSFFADGAVHERQIIVDGRHSVSFSDVVTSEFGIVESFGALGISGDPVGLAKLVVSSRVVNVSPAGEYGQAIPAYPSREASRPGELAVITGPRSAADHRFNFGIFALEPAEIEWSLLRADGSVAALRSLSYSENSWRQYNSGVETLFGVTPEGNDTIHARIVSGRAFLYGSIVNAATGDPSFVPAARTRDNLAPIVLGIDRTLNGVIDYPDVNQDGVIDSTIEVATSRFPTFFRIIAVDPEGDPISFTIIGGSSDVRLIDDAGTIQWMPGADVKGTSGQLVVRVTDGMDWNDVIIPVQFR